MSNETKREVLKKALDFLMMSGIERSTNYDMERHQYLSEYDNSLPDDLPVIPEEVSDYIRKTTAPGKNGLIEVFCSLADDIRAVGHDNIYKWELWMLNNQAAVARAWVLGVWRVEETGEVVKL